MRPLLVGELNPYGADPEFALYPLPEHASGGRLARILGLSRTQYLRAFDRTNLCYGKWSLAQARVLAMELASHRPVRPLVLLGAKVCGAFRFAYHPFTQHSHYVYILPHPSGRNSAWNDPSAAERARELLRPLLA